MRVRSKLNVKACTKIFKTVLYLIGLVLTTIFLSTETNLLADSRIFGTPPVLSAPSTFGAGNSHLTTVPSKDGWTEIPLSDSYNPEPVEEKVYIGKNGSGEDVYFCYASFEKYVPTYFPLIYLMDGSTKVSLLNSSYGAVGGAMGYVPRPNGLYPFPEDLKYYQKTAPNGLKSFWISYNSRFIELMHNPVHVDEILEGRANGGVKVSYYLTNVYHDQPTNDLINFSLNGWSMLVGEVILPGHLLSNHRGLCFDTVDQKYRLNVLFNDPTYADNWRVDPFMNIDDTGLETEVWDPLGDHVATPSYGSEIIYKNMPVDLLRGQTTMLAWEYSVNLNDVPSITLDQVDQDYAGGDFTISGYWRDLNIANGNLYYQIDDGTKVKFTTVNNPMPGEDYQWNYTISRSVLSPLTSGPHTIKVWGVNTTNQQSNQTKVVLNFPVSKPKLTVKYQSLANNGTLNDIPGVTEDVSNNNEGTAFTVAPKVINDGYNFNLEQTKLANQAVPGLTYNDATGEISGQYSQTDQQIIFVYDVGQLVLKAPQLINFGEHKLNNDVTYWPYVTNGNTNEKLEVIDNRPSTQKTNWYIDAELIDSTITGNDAEMPEGMIVFKNAGVEEVLRKTSSVEIYRDSSVAQTPGSVITRISDRWDQNNGLFIKAERKKVQAKHYVGTIQWTCIKAVP